MIKILHNSRCSKSREALSYLENIELPFEVRNYLEEPLSKEEIQVLLKKLNLKPSQIIRTNEALWKDNYKGKEYSDTELISILSKNPKLIQRPIVIKDDHAVIGRPLENVVQLLKE